MKYYKIILFTTMIYLLLTSCTNGVNKENTPPLSIKDKINNNQVITETKKNKKKMSYLDIYDAGCLVEEKINNEFLGCNLVSLAYDADKTEEAPKDVIVLYSVFTTDSSVIPGVNSTMQANTTYKWTWTIVKAKDSGEWIIDHYGFD